jgi:hypothetical protein
MENIETKKKYNLYLYPYKFIIPDNNNFDNLNYQNVKNNQVRVVKLVNNKIIGNKSIIKYIPSNNNFFNLWEIFNKFKLLKNNINILELSTFPSFIETVTHFKRKNHLKNIKSNLITKYPDKNKNKHKKSIEYYLELTNNTNYNLLIKNLDNKSIFNKSNKYNLIYIDIPDNLFYKLIYGIYNLKEKGNLIIATNKVTNIVSLGKLFFENIEIYLPEITNFSKQFKNFVIFSNFKGNEHNKTLRNMITFMDNNVKFKNKIDEMIKNNSDIENYKKEKEKRILNYKSKLLLLNKLTEDKKEELKKEQYISSVIWAKKYNIDYYELDKNYKYQFEKLILEDMYNIHKEISYLYTKKDDNKTTKMSTKINKLNNKLLLVTSFLDTRDFRKWNTTRRKVAFYRPLFKDIDIVKRVQRLTNIPTISQAWLKMFEILVKYPLINNKDKSIKTFHMCEAPGNFISATDYFIKNRTNIKNFDWKAQSLISEKNNTNPLGNQYGFMKKYSNRWLFGPKKTGDITDIDNLKYYKNIIKDCNLVTSDCGISDLAKGYDKLIAKINYCQIIGILNGLSKGSNVVIKTFQKYYYPALYSCLYMMYLSFDRLYVHKSVLNRQSPEFYLVGINFRDDNRKKLDEMFDFIKEFDESKDLFGTYPTDFVKQTDEIMEKIAENFLFEIERIVYYFDNYDNLGLSGQNEIKHYIDKKNDEWLEKNKFI